jgi:hypothetical protein
MSDDERPKKDPEGDIQAHPETDSNEYPEDKNTSLSAKSVTVQPEPAATDDEPDNSDDAAVATVSPVAPSRGRRLWQWVTSHKKVSIPAAIIVLVLALLAIPVTRYLLAGLVLKQTYGVTVIDAATKQPVSSAVVSLRGVQATTDSRGQAQLHVPVGKTTLSVTKKYYKGLQSEVLVPIARQKFNHEIQLTATGRQITITLRNTISKQPLTNATVRAAGTEAKTNQQGQAILVVPANQQAVTVTLSATGYNEAKQTVQVTGQTLAANDFTLTPTGKLYFLSNKTGKIDVVKTNLDGSAREVVVAGTGKEEAANTSLLASRDWKYLALHARRDSEKPKLYLIDTATDKLTVMDEGDAAFSLVGWSNHDFAYTVERDKIPYWQGKHQAIKSYNASTQKLTTLDETRAEGSQDNAAYEYLNTPYLVNNEVVFVKSWSSYGRYNYNDAILNGKQLTLNSVRTDGAAKKVIKGYDRRTQEQYASLELRAYKANEVYVLYDKGEKNSTVEEYDNGQLTTAAGITRNDFYNKPYATYLVSPNDKATGWSESRDGKTAVFAGDSHGSGEKQVALLPPEYYVYGWHSDNYLLVSKSGNELYAMPIQGTKDEKALLKITDYYRPGRTFPGYGGGYGGL